jgi:hypothetical protein
LSGGFECTILAVSYIAQQFIAPGERAVGEPN